MSDRPHIFVLAGVNGAGKSSIGGAAIRASVGGFLEEEDGGQGFAGDVVSPEDGDHLVGQDADLGESALDGERFAKKAASLGR